MTKICRTLGIPFDVVSFDETERVRVERIAQQLQAHAYTHVAIVHCETSSGILNPIDEIGQLVYEHGAQKGSLSRHDRSLQGSLSFGRLDCLHRRLDECLRCYPCQLATGPHQLSNQLSE